jgi:hypothetical protein
MSSWNAQLLRLTLFVRQPVDGSGLWQAVVGTAPEIDEHKPREGLRRQAGQVDDALLEMGVAANRLDWVMSPPVEMSLPDPTHHLGDPRTVADKFDRLLTPWLGNLDFEVIRIAIGIVAISPEANRAAAYAHLQELVPSVTYDAEHTREVLYQVNRPARSEMMPGLELNRLTKWSAARFVSQNISFAVGGVITAAEAEIRHFARCECDHSTPAERTKVIENKSLLPIYEELRKLAMLNLERGELG